MHSQKARERSSMHQPPRHIPIYMSFSPSTTLPYNPSSRSRSVHTDVGSCHQLITYSSERRFGLIDVAYKGQEGHTTACTE